MQSIQIEKSPIHGHGLFATKDIEPGEEIYSTPRIFLGVLSWEKLSFMCSNCFKIDGHGLEDPVIQNKACTGCRLLHFCGKKCQKQAWQRYHKVECKKLAAIPKDKTTMVHSSQRILIQVLLLRKHQLIDDDNWEMLLDLEDHFDSRNDEIQSQGDWMADSTLSFCDIGNHFPKSTVKSIYFKLTTNMLTITQNDLTPIGSGLDLVISNANHSCSPNASVTMESRRISFRALQPIRKGQEVYVSYIDETMSFYYRQKELRDNYFFTCACSLCIQGTKTPQDAFLKRFSQASEGFQKVSRSYLSTHSETTSETERNRFKDSDPDSPLLSAAEAKLHLHYTKSKLCKNPNERIFVLESLCQSMYSSKIWPLHRYPYAQARYDLIEEYNLGTREYKKAGVHVAKVYTSIHPVLFPSPCHPKRVMNTVYLFEMLVGLSATPEAPVFPVDLTAALYVLGKECTELVVKSHGTESELTHVVFNGPFQQVYNELKAKDPGAFNRERGMRAMEALKAYADTVPF